MELKANLQGIHELFSLLIVLGFYELYIFRPADSKKKCHPRWRATKKLAELFAIGSRGA
jgi:hypothetical protein